MKKNSVQDVLAQDVSATAHLAGASDRHRVLSGMQPSADSPVSYTHLTLPTKRIV